MPTPHTHTPQQIALFETVPPSSSSVAIRARAGSSKTYSLQRIASLTRGTGLSTSFSTSTVAELAKKMPSSFPARTMHSIGFQAIRTAAPTVKLERSKVFNLTKDFLNSQDDIERRELGTLLKLVSLAKTFGITPAHSSGLIPDTPPEWEKLADQFDVPYSPVLQHGAREILTQSNTLSLTSRSPIIDFDDMLYIALLYPHSFPRYPTIIADEVQDFNILQHLMLQRLLRPGGRLIAAGDDRQAIYAFRGALSDSYSALTRRFDMIDMPLTVSFRCPHAGVLEAQRYVPDIEAAPGALEGEVYWHEEMGLNSIPPVILCRNNAPLITLSLRLLAAGHSVEVAGRDIGKGLISLTKRISKRNLKSSVFIDRLNRWAEREISRKPKLRGRVNDKCEALTAIALAHRDLRSIQTHLDKLYPDPKSKSYRPAEFYLSTIHRAKGREWPEILFLDPQLLPSKWAEQEWELTQEDNLAYVGVTRFQHTLHYVKSKHIV